MTKPPIPTKQTKITTDGGELLTDGRYLLPGVLVTPDPERDGRVNLTHEMSGLAVAVGLPRVSLVFAKHFLGSLDWQVTVRALRDDPNYYRVIMALEDKLLRSKMQEERIAADFEGKRQPASGSRPGKKRDVVSEVHGYMFEAKTFLARRRTISIKDLLFLRRQAFMRGLTPIYIVELDGHEEIVVVPATEFDDLDMSKAAEHKINQDSVPLSIDDLTDVLEGGIRTFKLDHFVYAVFSYSTLLSVAHERRNT